MIDHVAVNVSNLESARRFYEKALAPLGFAVGPAFPDWVGFAREGKTVFWLARRDPLGGSVHIAFAAERRADVDKFYAAALSTGGRDHGKPGLRPDYHADYYGAFVFDLDGNNVEAVCHKSE